MNFFKDHVIGIFALAVAASIAAAFLYDYLDLKPRTPTSRQSESPQSSVSGTASAATSRTAPPAQAKPTKTPSPARSTASNASANTEQASPSGARPDSYGVPRVRPVVLQPGPPQAKDIWTTSVYSFAPDGGGPGGGLYDEKLIVGGWGDSYHSLLQFDLRSMPPSAQLAKLELFCKSRETSNVGMLLDRITEPWDWRSRGSGSDRERLWWADRPRTVQWQQSVLPPCRPGTWYEIDITDLYNAWQKRTYENYGLQLRPVRNDNRWNEFHSSKYSADPSLRPRLIVQR